ILTQKYAIECKRYLSRAALFAAAGQLRTYEPHFPEQTPVIAGLTPESEASDYNAVADRLKTSGIEIWFIDQMEPLMEYYHQLAKQPLEEEVTLPGFKLPRPLAGLAVALGIAGILAASFAIAYSILSDTETRLTISVEEQERWDRFHDAASVWDINSAQAQLNGLTDSKNRCVRAFATRQLDSLTQKGAEGFRDLNALKRALNDEENCELEVTPFDFSP
ncbi:MAG TPA: hypothetical protein V6D06_20840, partial [Trichocoleus sp.]